MGDFNCPHISWSTFIPGTNSLSFEKDFITTVADLFLHQAVTLPTRITAEGGTILDLILVPLPDAIQDLKHLPPVGTSDHNTLLWTTLTAGTVGPECQTSIRKKYRSANFDNIKQDMNAINWNESFKEAHTIEDMYHVFENIVIAIIETHTPTTTHNPAAKKKDYITN